MHYQTFQPHPSLAKYVRFFWSLEGEANANTPYIHRSMAEGCTELLFHYNGVFDELLSNGKTESSFQSGISGQSQKVRRFTINQNFGMFGVYLYPFAISHLFSVPANELTNQMPDLKSILGIEADELEEKMMLAINHSARVNILSSFLLQRIQKASKQPPGIFETIQHVIDTHGSLNVKDLAARNFLSTRQFERKFMHYAGFTPKLFSRIIRFQHTVSQYGAKDTSLTDIAYSAGYYDQSHFIQDFKAFSGHNPKAYFSGKTETTVWKDI